MGELTKQVIQNWAQRPTPSPFEPDIKSSFLKLAVKSEILTPSHTVSIAPISYKVEVDPLVFSDQFFGLPLAIDEFFELPGSVNRIHQSLFQSIEIKQLLKLSFKGEKEVAFKTKSSVEYSSKEDDESKKQARNMVTLTVASSAIFAILGEVYANQKSKEKQKILWLAHAGMTRFLFMVFNGLLRAKIHIEGIKAVQPPDPNHQSEIKPPADDIQPLPISESLSLASDDLIADPIGEVHDPLPLLVQDRQDAADTIPEFIPKPLQENSISLLVDMIEDAENAILQLRIDVVGAAGVEAELPADRKG